MLSVIPAQAGIQKRITIYLKTLDSRFHGNDKSDELGVHIPTFYIKGK